MDILDQLHVNPRIETPLVLQLKEQLHWLIASGQIPPGQTLPPIRQAAQRLGINLHTVRHAYQKLAEQGLVEMRQGSPTRVLPYDPLQPARLAGTPRSHLLGMIVPNLDNPLYVQYLRGVEEAARPEHSLLLVCDAHDDPEEALLYFRKLAEKQVDGILLFSFDLEEFIPRGPGQLPYVTVDWPVEQGYCVTCDFQDGAQQVVQHLLEDGHRRIGLINFAMNIPAAEQMQAGYRLALAQAGLALEESLIAPVYGFDQRSGEDAARALLALPQPPSAIFAMSDLLAMGALRALRAAGLRVPDDLALAGANDIPVASLLDPPLTTIHQPAAEMGRQAMRMLQTLMTGSEPPQSQLCLPTNLVIRQSCGKHGS